jgi:hypothetical protein
MTELVVGGSARIEHPVWGPLSGVVAKLDRSGGGVLRVDGRRVGMPSQWRSRSKADRHSVDITFTASDLWVRADAQWAKELCQVFTGPVEPCQHPATYMTGPRQGQCTVCLTQVEEDD